MLTRILSKVCLRRLLTVAVFLLSWTLCNAAPWSDTPAANHAAVVNTRRRYQNNHKNSDSHEKKSKQDDKTNYDEHITRAATSKLPVFVSNLVAFSKDMPPPPPLAMEAFDNLRQDKQIGSKNDQLLSQTGSSLYRKRDKRSAQAQQAVCDSVHNWERKRTAIDIYGNNITVMEKILTNGGEEVSQWFYETTCATSGPTTSSCRGIDTQTWDSECLSRQSFVYAMIRTRTGEEGWNWIAINTACNCALRRKSVRRGLNRRAPYPFVALTETERR